MQPTLSRSAICAMILAMYACAAHAQRQAPIRDIAPIIESSVTQEYQPPVSQPNTSQADTLQGRELAACLERKQKIDSQQQKLAVLAQDLRRDKQLVAVLEQRIEQEKPKRSTHSVQAMNQYQALLRQYQQQANSLNERTELYNQLVENNRISVRQYNHICSGKAYRAAELPADSDYGVQPIQRRPNSLDTVPQSLESSPSAYPAAAVPGVPSVGSY